MTTKQYIGFANDHSSSMGMLRDAAIKDYNANIAAVRDASSREVVDTIVSVTGFAYDAERQVTVSNPHILEPINSWKTHGNTAMYDAIGDLITMHLALPDANNENVGFLILVTTDGAENSSKTFNLQKLRMLINQVSQTGRWTFVFRVPKTGDIQTIKNIGIPEGNIQFWDTTAAGMAKSTQETTKAMDTFFASRKAGAKSSGSFYSDASNVNVAALVDISKKISLYVVQPDEEGMQIRDKILKHRMQYLKGAAFYQLTKTESKVSHTKLILIRDQATGKFFGGQEARTMIGLPNDRNARLHPGDHSKFDIFIQSESINRKLVGGTGIAYWEEKGVPFTPEELERHNGVPKATVTKPAVIQLAKVPVSTKPTKSPIPVTPQVKYFTSRREAREFAAMKGKSVVDNGKQAAVRWSV